MMKFERKTGILKSRFWVALTFTMNAETFLNYWNGLASLSPSAVDSGSINGQSKNTQRCCGGHKYPLIFPKSQVRTTITISSRAGFWNLCCVVLWCWNQITDRRPNGSRQAFTMTLLAAARNYCPKYNFTGTTKKSGSPWQSVDVNAPGPSSRHRPSGIRCSNG